MRNNTDPFYRELGRNIARIRHDRRLTQIELGRQIGASQNVIASYETGRRRIPVKALVEISVDLHVLVSDFIPPPATHGQSSSTELSNEALLEMIMNLSPQDRLAVISVVKALDGHYPNSM
jgi:transcriptional regulator with XRE-family HTH domain